MMSQIEVTRRFGGVTVSFPRDVTQDIFDAAVPKIITLQAIDLDVSSSNNITSRRGFLTAKLRLF